jgi:hypothetical protein
MEHSRVVLARKIKKRAPAPKGSPPEGTPVEEVKEEPLFGTEL